MEVVVTDRFYWISNHTVLSRHLVIIAININISIDIINMSVVNILIIDTIIIVIYLNK